MPQNLWESSLVQIRPRPLWNVRWYYGEVFLEIRKGRRGVRGVREGEEREVIVLKQRNANCVEDNPTFTIWFFCIFSMNLCSVIISRSAIIFYGHRISSWEDPLKYKIWLKLYFFRFIDSSERERERSREGRGKGRQRSSNRFHVECRAQLGLDLQTLSSWPEPKLRVCT